MLRSISGARPVESYASCQIRVAVILTLLHCNLLQQLVTSDEFDSPVAHEVGLGVVGGILGEFSRALIAQAANNIDDDQDESKSMLRKCAGQKPHRRDDRTAVMA